MAAADTEVVIRHKNRHEIERRSRPESSHKGNLKRLKTSSVGGFQRWEKENELLWAMLEDETEWLAKLFPDIIITPELFFYALEDGVVLCRLANLIQEAADDYGRKNKVKVPAKTFKFHTSIPKKNKQLALFKSRENVQGFLTWCRQIGISDSILFESNDVVEADECREGCREVVICLMEIARRASGSFKFTPIPKLIQLEKEIEIEEQEEENSIDQVDYASSDEESSSPGPEAHSPPTGDGGDHTTPGGSKKKSKKHQPKSELDKEVYKIIDNFNVYNIRKIKEGKYMILGKIIFVRMLNGHILLRIGGGWDTLEHYLLTHLPKAAPENNGHCSTEAAVSPSVSKTPQKSQLTKILDKVKKEQQLKATPVSSPHRTAATKGSKTDEGSGDDEKDITSAIRKIEFSVNQNIATRRKISRHSNEETPQKSPNSVEEKPASFNTPSDINQNNITSEGQKLCKSKSPEKRRSMENEAVFNAVNGDFELKSEEQNDGESLDVIDGVVKEDESAENGRQSETMGNDIDATDGGVMAKLNMDTDPIEVGQVIELESEPKTDLAKDSSTTEQSSVPDFAVSVDYPEAEQPPPAEAVTETPDVLPSERELPKDESDVCANDSEIPSNDSEPSPSGDVQVPPSDTEVPASDSDVRPCNPDVAPVDAEDAKDSESPSPAPDSSSASTTPDIPQSPQKSPSPTGKKDGAESPKKITGKPTKGTTGSKPAGTKAPAKKVPVHSAGARPTSAKPSTRPATAGSSTTRDTKRPASAVRSSRPTTAKPSTTASKTTTTASKPSSVASKTKTSPTGKPTTTGGKISPTQSAATKKPSSKPEAKAATSTRTAKPDPKAPSATRTARPAKSTAFGSTVSTARKPAQNARPATAPPARSTTTQAKKKPVTAKVQSWSSTARPQSAKPSTKGTAKDSTDGGASSKETGKQPNGDRPTSPTKPLVRKTQTRTVTTLKTTRVGTGGEPEVKSQTIKTTRTVTEANGKKTTKTTVKEIAPTGRKPLRMTTETTEGGTGNKKTTKAVMDSKTGTRTARPGTKKTETKPGPSRPSKETGAKKAPAKAGPKSKEVSGQVKGVPKAKTVKELSNALGITKPADEKEKKEKEIETEPVDVKEIANKDMETKQDETPAQNEDAPAKNEESPAQIEQPPAEIEETPVPIEEAPAKDEEAPAQIEETPAEIEEAPEPIEEAPAKDEEAPAQDEESPAQIEEPPAEIEEAPEPIEEAPEKDEEAPKPIEEAPARNEETPAQTGETPACAPVELSPEEEVAHAEDSEQIDNHEDTESGTVNVEGGIDEVPQGYEVKRGDSVEETEEQNVEHENGDVSEQVEDIRGISDHGLVNGDTDEQSTAIVSDVNLTGDGEEEKPTAENSYEQMNEGVEQVDVTEKHDEVGEEVGNEDESSDGRTMVTTTEQDSEACEGVIVPDSPELRDPSETVDDSNVMQDKGFDGSMEDDSLDVIEVPESDVSHDENAFQLTEAWPAVSVDNKERVQDIDLLGDNNNAVEAPLETEPKFDPYLFASVADPEEPADSSADQNLLDFSVDDKAESSFGADLGITDEATNRDSGFQENNTVDDLLG